jgi:hypothetical protein
MAGYPECLHTTPLQLCGVRDHRLAFFTFVSAVRSPSPYVKNAPRKAKKRMTRISDIEEYQSAQSELNFQ